MALKGTLINKLSINQLSEVVLRTIGQLNGLAGDTYDKRIAQLGLSGYGALCTLQGALPSMAFTTVDNDNCCGEVDGTTISMHIKIKDGVRTWFWSVGQMQ